MNIVDKQIKVLGIIIAVALVLVVALGVITSKPKSTASDYFLYECNNEYSNNVN